MKVFEWKPFSNWLIKRPQFSKTISSLESNRLIFSIISTFIRMPPLQHTFISKATLFIITKHII